MKKFNKKVSVEMSADSIADMFLNSQAFLFDNKESFIESIVGTCIEKDTLGIVLAGFMGVTPKCELAIGTDVYCSKMIYDYWTEESRKDCNSVSREIGQTIITDINPYSENCYKIEFTTYRSDGGQYTQEKWVSKGHIAVSEPIIV